MTQTMTLTKVEENNVHFNMWIDGEFMGEFETGKAPVNNGLTVSYQKYLDKH